MKKTSKKKLKFLADESLGLKVAKNIANLGIDITAIGEIARGANDAEVLTKSVEEQRILITTDKDFGYLVFKEKLLSYGVILLRLKEESVVNLTYHINKLLKRYSSKLKGNFTVVTEEKIRVKKI